jgi:hypothetical protein
MSMSPRRKVVVSLAVAVVLSTGFAEAQMVGVVDGCDVGGMSWDINLVSATFDYPLQQIAVDVILCAPVDNRTKYRVHFDHTAPFAPDLDRNGDGTIDEADFCVTTSDDTMIFRGHRGLGKTTGPGDIVVSLPVTISYTVPLAELSTDLMTGDTVYIWADTQWKGIRDRAPNTEEADGCAKPEVASETLELVLLPPPTPTPTPVPPTPTFTPVPPTQTPTPVPPTPTPTPIPPTPTPTDTPTPIAPTPTDTPTPIPPTPTPIPPTPTPTDTPTPIPPTPTPTDTPTPIPPTPTSTPTP